MRVKKEKKFGSDLSRCASLFSSPSLFDPFPPPALPPKRSTMSGTCTPEPPRLRSRGPGSANKARARAGVRVVGDQKEDELISGSWAAAAAAAGSMLAFFFLLAEETRHGLQSHAFALEAISLRDTALPMRKSWRRSEQEKTWSEASKRASERQQRSNFFRSPLAAAVAACHLSALLSLCLSALRSLFSASPMSPVTRYIHRPREKREYNRSAQPNRSAR